jgi:hypothetical protein
MPDKTYKFVLANERNIEEDMALLAAIKVIEYRDVDYETAKKEVAGYFRMKGEAYASDASSDLELDYELVCKIMDDLELEGQMEISLRRALRSATPSMVTGS